MFIVYVITYPVSFLFEIGCVYFIPYPSILVSCLKPTTTVLNLFHVFSLVRLMENQISSSKIVLIRLHPVF